MYLVARGRQDRALDTDGTLARAVHNMRAWFERQSDGKSLRIDTVDGLPDIGFVQLRADDNEIIQENRRNGIARAVGSLMQAAGWSLAPDKVYAAFIDNAPDFACGAGLYPFAAVSLGGVTSRNGACDRGYSPGAFPLRGIESTLMHELLHALGAVPSCAPNVDAGGHVRNSPEDIMQFLDRQDLDTGRDDYYGHGRSDCPDLRRSAYLTPTEPNAEIPRPLSSTPARNAGAWSTR